MRIPECLLLLFLFSQLLRGWSHLANDLKNLTEFNWYRLKSLFNLLINELLYSLSRRAFVRATLNRYPLKLFPMWVIQRRSIKVFRALVKHVFIFARESESEKTSLFEPLWKNRGEEYFPLETRTLKKVRLNCDNQTLKSPNWLLSSRIDHLSKFTTRKIVEKYFFHFFHL